MHFSKDCFCAIPWACESVLGALCGPFLSSLQPHRSLGVSHIFWGLVSQVLVLKVRMPNVGYKTFTPQSEAPGVEFPYNGSWHQQWEFWLDCISAFPTHFDRFSFGLPNVKGSVYKFLISF